MSSQAGIEQNGGKLGSAGTNHVAVIRLLTTLNASCERTPGVDEGATDTGGENNELIWVTEVDEFRELFEERSSIAESVDDVEGLSQLNGGNVELCGVLGKPDLPGIHN